MPLQYTATIPLPICTDTIRYHPISTVPLPYHTIPLSYHIVPKRHLPYLDHTSTVSLSYIYPYLSYLYTVPLSYLYCTSLILIVPLPYLVCNLLISFDIFGNLSISLAPPCLYHPPLCHTATVPLSISTTILAISNIPLVISSVPPTISNAPPQCTSNLPLMCL